MSHKPSKLPPSHPLLSPISHLPALNNDPDYLEFISFLYETLNDRSDFRRLDDGQTAIPKLTDMMSVSQWTDQETDVDMDGGSIGERIVVPLIGERNGDNPAVLPKMGKWTGEELSVAGKEA